MDISNSAAAGNITATGNNAGGLIGNIYNYDINPVVNVSNSCATGNVAGASNVGGLIGNSYNHTYEDIDWVDPSATNISNSYSTGIVTGEDPTTTSGFVGNVVSENGGVTTATNSYYNLANGATDLSGATGEEESWFTPTNLGSIGITVDPPEPTPAPTPTPTPSGGTGSITFQIGTGAGGPNTISVDMDFEVGELSVNLMDADSARSALVEIDNLIQKVTKMQGGMGASSNIIDSVIDNNTQTRINLAASNSRLIDADIARESAEMVKNQIRQNMTASLLTQATNNLGPIALTLMGIR